MNHVKVLEIGEFELFSSTIPENTEAYFTGYRAPHRHNRPYFGIRAFLCTLRAARRGDYDLIVIAPPLYPGWSLVSVFSALKYTIAKWQPRELWGALTSPLFFSLTRFFPGERMIAIDRSDSFGLPRHCFFLLDKAQAFFKRELPLDHWQALYGSAHPRLPGMGVRLKRRWRNRVAKLRPIGLGLDRVRSAEAYDAATDAKTHDIFFAGMIDGNSSVRALVPAQMAALEAAGVAVNWQKEAVPRADFYRHCAQAWLTLSPAGLGWDCFRHVEAALCGSVPLVSTPTIDRFKPYETGVQCLVYDPHASRFVEMVKAALADKERLAGMAQAARDHAMKHLTDAAICRALLEEFGPGRIGDD